MEAKEVVGYFSDSIVVRRDKLRSLRFKMMNGEMERKVK